MGINIYQIDIWGPCRDPNQIPKLRKGDPSNCAVVLAPDVQLANQFCFLTSTRDERGEATNYQDIGFFAKPPLCIIRFEKFFKYSSDIVVDLLREPILPPVLLKDRQESQNELFNVSWFTSKEKGDVWIYAPDETTANGAVVDFGEAQGWFDANLETIRVSIEPQEGAFVFWDANIVDYEHVYKYPADTK